MRWGGRFLRVAGAILLGIFWGRRGPDLARGDEPAPKPPAAAPTAPAVPAAPKPAPGTGTLTGVVRTATGPAAGAKVALYRQDIEVVDRMGRFDADAFAARYLHPTSVEPTVPEVGADKEGRFRIEGLPPGAYEAFARAAEGPGIGRLWPAVVEGGREGQAELVLDGAPTALEGKVTYADGRPFDGYVFASFETDGSQFPLPYGGLPTHVRPDGTFRFDALPADPCFVYVTAPGRAASLTYGPSFGAVKPGTRIDLVVDPGASPVVVLVVDAETRLPVPGAVVRSFVDKDMVLRWREAVAGSDGKAALLGWGKLRATAPGYLPGEKDAAEAATATLELRRGGTVRGTVRGPDGAGVAGVPVHVVGAWDRRVRTTRSGPGGAYEVSALPAAILGIVAIGEDWVPADALALAREPNAAVPLDLTTKALATVDLRVVRGASARVLVESPDHEPLAGATVSQWTPSSGRMGTPPWMMDVMRPDEPAVTAADGTVELRGLIPGFSYPVGAEATGFVAGRGAVVPSVEIVASTILTLELGRTITIRVLERGTHAPIPGATVEMLTAPKRGAYRRHVGERTTGADGTVRFEGLPRSEAACSVEAPLHVATREQIRALDGSDSDDADLAYDLEFDRGLTVAGRVVRSDGKPLHMPSVKSDPVETGGGVSDRPWRMGYVWPDGTFRVEGLAPGRVRLEAEDLLEGGKGESIAVAVEAEAGATGVEITLPRPPAPEAPQTARLLVLTPDGKPIHSAVTEIWGGGSSTSGATVRDGVLELDPGTLDGLRVDFALARDAEGHALPFGPAHFGPGAADAREAEVRLPPGVVAEGQVVDSEGRPVPGVSVTARPEAVDAEGRAVWKCTWHGNEKTGADGRFRFVGLAAEPYSFELEVPRGFAAGPRVQVNAPASDVVIRVDRSVDVVLTVLDASGAPAMGAAVDAQPDGERYHASLKAIVDAAGHARLVGLHPTRPYTLGIEPPPRSAGMLTYERKGWIAREETVRLARAGTVTGTIVDGAGRPWPSASVRWWVGEKEQRDVNADGAGRFELEHLEPGEIVLSAFGGEGRRDPEPELAGPRKTVTVGATGVTLTALRGVELTVRIAAPDLDAWKGSSAWVSRLHPTNLAGAKIHAVAIGADGTFRSGPLVTGARYAIWIPVGRTGLTALKPDVVGAPGELVLTPVPGQTIRGRLVADKPLNAPSRWIDAYGTGWNLRVQPDTEGRFELRGVPDGSCVLRGEATIGDTYYTGLLRDVRPGADVEVRIQPER